MLVHMHVPADHVHSSGQQGGASPLEAPDAHMALKRTSSSTTSPVGTSSRT